LDAGESRHPLCGELNNYPCLKELNK
jgi:hypothetical protein